jgi:hypothetical protein
MVAGWDAARLPERWVGVGRAGGRFASDRDRPSLCFVRCPLLPGGPHLVPERVPDRAPERRRRISGGIGDRCRRLWRRQAHRRAYVQELGRWFVLLRVHVISMVRFRIVSRVRRRSDDGLRRRHGYGLGLVDVTDTHSLNACGNRGIQVRCIAYVACVLDSVCKG